MGHKRGGIAIVCVIVACFFGAISGSGPVTVAALGAVLIPAMIDEAGQKAVEYQRYINRAGDEEIKDRWTEENGVTITELEDIDIESFKAAVEGVDEWYVEELEKQGFENVEELVAAFTAE